MTVTDGSDHTDVSTVPGGGESFPSPVDEARFRHGVDILRQVDGDAGEQVVAALADVAPALAHHVVAFGFGDIYARPGLDLRQRELLSIAFLTALGGCEPQLRVHVQAALNVGLTTVEIIEAITQSAVYCGFPKAINACLTAKDVFIERNLLPSSANPGPIKR